MNNSKLDMTYEQMEEEIIFMRKWNEYLQNHMDKKEYEFLMNGFCRETAYTRLVEELGVDKKVASEICDKVEKEMNITGDIKIAFA